MKLLSLNSVVRILFSLLLAVPVSVSGREVTTDNAISYGAPISHEKTPMQVFKITDNHGKITYASSLPDKHNLVEEIVIASPPSDEDVSESVIRSATLEAAAKTLGVARYKREAKREQEETKRLQRLALINNARLPTINQRNVFFGFPHRLKHHHASHSGYQPVPHTSNLPLPPSSFNKIQ